MSHMRPLHNRYVEYHINWSERGCEGRGGGGEGLRGGGCEMGRWVMVREEGEYGKGVMGKGRWWEEGRGRDEKRGKDEEKEGEKG